MIHKKSNQDCGADGSLLQNGEISSLKIEEEWVDSKTAARYLKISDRTLYNLTSNGKIVYYKFGRRNRYRLSELKKLLLAQRRGGFYGY